MKQKNDDDVLLSVKITLKLAAAAAAAAAVCTHQLFVI